MVTIKRLIVLLLIIQPFYSKYKRKSNPLLIFFFIYSMNNSATQKNINKEDWLLWQFADSALPTGGFVASSGLEVAVQSGYVKDNNSLLIFLSSSIENYAYSALPFVTDSWQVISQTSNNDDDNDDNDALIFENIIKLDYLYETCTSNVITKRASKAQGVAMLTLFSKSFGEEFSEDNEGKRNISDRIIDKFKFEVRKESTFGHLPVAFGLVSKCLGISLGKLIFYGIYICMYIYIIFLL